MTLAYAGCRLSEALAVTVDRVDLAAGVLVLETPKKRRSGVYRGVPPALFAALDLVHGVREARSCRGKGRGIRLLPWSRAADLALRRRKGERWAVSVHPSHIRDDCKFDLHQIEERGGWR
jgi:integrase